MHLNICWSNVWWWIIQARLAIQWEIRRQTNSWTGRVSSKGWLKESKRVKRKSIRILKRALYLAWVQHMFIALIWESKFYTSTQLTFYKVRLNSALGSPAASFKNVCRGWASVWQVSNNMLTAKSIERPMLTLRKAFLWSLTPPPCHIKNAILSRHHNGSPQMNPHPLRETNCRGKR